MSLPLPFSDLLVMVAKNAVHGQTSDCNLRQIISPTFLTSIVESTSFDTNAHALVCIVALYCVLDNKTCPTEREPYALFLERMKLDREFHSSKEIPVLIQQFEGLDKDLYIRLANYAKQRIEFSGCIIDKLSMDGAYEIAILTFVLTHWSTFFHSCFNADMSVSKLWSIYEKLYKFTGEHEELCRKYPGIFLYMYDVMEKKHNGCDEAEKENAWKLWENTKFMCQNFNCMEDPE